MDPAAPKAVFLSYASQDADAARRIAQALRAEGVEVWFDESALGGGEAWDASIRRQIRDCALFVAIVSANTQARKEGYFRLEWKLADERSQLIAEGTPFVLPVIIDGTKERDALVPKSFLGVQWTWLPHGEVPPGFVARVQRLLNPTAAVSTMSKPAFATNTASATTVSPVASAETAEPAVTTARRAPRTAFVLLAGVLIALFVVAAVVGIRDKNFGALMGSGSRPSASSGVTRFTIMLPPGQAVLSRPAISRDGRMIAYTAGTPTEEPRLYLRRLAESESRDVPGTSGASQPFFSPDGRSIAFFANGRLLRVSIGGGAPVFLADATWPLGGSWCDDNTIIFVPMWNAGLFRIPASGGTPEALLRPDGKQDYAFVFPRFVPDRREILFTAWGKNFGVWALNLSNAERSKVVFKGDSGTVTTSGHLLAGFGDESPEAMGIRPGLIAVPYGEGMPSSHAPTLVVPGINYAQWQPDLWCSVADNGTLAYVPADVGAKSLVLVDQTGHAELFSGLPGVYTGVSVSRTTGRIAAAAGYRVWRYAADGASRELLAPENRDSDESRPAWTPDGKAVVYASNLSGNWDIYRRIPGATKSDILLNKEHDQGEPVISPNGTIAHSESHPVTGYDIWLLDADGKSRPWLVTPRNEIPSRFSPDGKWLAYRSDESGRFEIYVKPVEGDATRVQISTAGAVNAAWSPKGNVLYYQEAGAMWEVDLGSGETPVPGPRRKLFEGGWALSPFGDWDYSDIDVMPDGERFLMIRREPKAIPDRINVVLNWYDELRQLVPVK